MNIHLLHTNDIHSSLENHIRLGYRLRSLREHLLARGEPVMTLDLGDVLDRVRPETEVTRGLINTRLMQALEYDAWVFGNNEGLTIPAAGWDDLVEESAATWLATNLRDANGRPFAFGEDALVRTFGSVTVGLFGITENFERPYEVLGVRVLDPIETARHAVASLRHAGCDVVIAMSHLGLWRDREVAAQVDGLDLILGGHSHTFMDTAEWVHGTAIFQAGKYALAFGHTRIEFDETTGSLGAIACCRVDVDTHGPLDDAMMGVLLAHRPQIQAELTRTVFTLPETLPVRLDAESPFANLLVDALFDAFDADLGVMMSGALTASLLAGPVQLRHVLAACSTPTRPIRLTLTGSAIRSVLNKSVQSEWFLRQGFGYGFRGSVIGYLSLSNACVCVETSPIGKPVVRTIEIGGLPIEDDREYRMVTCEFLWLSPAFEEFHHATDVQFERPLVREVLLDFLQHNMPPSIAALDGRYAQCHSER